MPEETRDLSIGGALDLGVQFAMSGQHENAIGLFRGVLIHEPENFEAIERLGASLFETRRIHEALYWFWRGRRLNRRHPMALTNYGLCVCDLGHPEEGVVDLERAVRNAEKMPELSPEAKALCYSNLGNTLEKLHRYEDALVALDKAVTINPKDNFPHYNRGIVLLRLNRQAEGIASLERAIEINPNDADAHYNRGMARLLRGDLKGGFEDYEYRLVTSSNDVMNLGLPAQNKWHGTEPLVGKTILVHCEQGLGDDIQFFRFLPELIRMADPAKVLLICHSAVRPLLAPMERVTVLPPGHTFHHNDYDYWVASMSLPLCLGTTEATIPAPWHPVIEPERIEKWFSAVRSPERGICTVGVCWAGNFQHKNNRHRSIDLKDFSRVFAARGCSFVSVQQVVSGDAELFVDIQAKNANVRAFKFDDFRDTGAALLNCDIVLSVDTAVAHLSASLGIATWILIPCFGCDWRWQLERIDSPWYPSARLIRQDRIGDWAPTLKDVTEALEKEAESRSAKGGH